MKRYELTLGQLCKLWNRAADPTDPRGLEETMVDLSITVTPEPSADVVEKIEAELMKMVSDGREHYSVREMAEMACPIIEAEVERRVRERSKE